jgi:hypothetical protein
MFCEKCGTELLPSSKFCHECGQTSITTNTSNISYEYKEEVVDLRHLKFQFYQDSKEHQDAAWKVSSNWVMERIQLMGNQGWELVENKIGFSLLESKSVISGKGFLVDFAFSILGDNSAGATMKSELVCARLHFRKKI